MINVHAKGDSPQKQKAHESEEIPMRTIITLDAKKISKKAACEMYGEADVNKMIREAKKAFLEDPNEESTWWMGNGMLTIEFR